MIEYFKDSKTGEIKPNQTVDNQMYFFWREHMISDQDRANGVVTILTGDWSGVRLKDDKYVVRLEGIKFVLPDGNPRRTLSDYLEAEVILPDNAAELIDETQIKKVKNDAFILYKWYYVKQPEFIAKLPEPPKVFPNHLF